MKHFLVVFSLMFGKFVLSQEMPRGHPTVGGTAEPSSNPEMSSISPEEALVQFKIFASHVAVNSLRDIPVLHNGRVKPLDTLARESLVFINGSSRLYGLDSVQIYLSLIVSGVGDSLDVVEVRDPKLRQKLGLEKGKKRFSLKVLEKTELQTLAQPLFEKERRNSRSLKPDESKILETMNQVQLLFQIIDGSHFLQSIDFALTTNHSGDHSNSMILDKGKEFLSSLSQEDDVSQVSAELKSLIHEQEMSETFLSQIKKMDLEVKYNQWKLFFLTAIYLFCFGIVLIMNSVSKKLRNSLILFLSLVPVLLIGIGLTVRVLITGFAPVTNMYGTMIWVSLGIVLFSIVLFILYKNRVLMGILFISSSLVLFLTESIPLVLSPDLDPIVAVLRSNYWLTIHVLTITISYAAFSIAMILGNIALVRTLVFRPEQNVSFFKEYAHYAYRVMQLGVFLITVGIILGGIWADYSWGRFWGWDPKETWALIADVGFLIILHARYIGWLKDFGVLASATIAYLLVIMAWYGVNFILASGLHSYGFSSGGALGVGIFLGVQLVLFVLAGYRFLGARKV